MHYVHSAVLLQYVVRSSVCLSVTLMYRGSMCWVKSKVITRIISLGSSVFALRIHNIGNTVQGQHPQNSGGGWVALLNRKPTISSKRGSQCYYWRLIGSCIRAFDRYQNQWLWMTLNGHFALCFKIHVHAFSEPTRKFEWRLTHPIGGEDIAQWLQFLAI